MFTLQNELLTVQLNPTGAELHSLYFKPYGVEYLWRGDPLFWGKKSPILFPIVGTLKLNSYVYEGQSYALGRHGFAREKEFQVVESTGISVTFRLSSDTQTKIIYPFDFVLLITYELTDASLSVTYTVSNAGEKPLYFSLGAHPAFALPLEPGLGYEDYYLEFKQTETAPRWPITREGLLSQAPVPFFDRNRRLPLTKTLFYEDALVFKHLNSDCMTLASALGKRGLHFNFPGFPYLGLWAAKNADFICLEPWCGIADHEDADQQLIHKVGINVLSAGDDWERTWSVQVF